MPTLNPIIPGFNPDPTICRVGPDYFVATSTFEFFPGVPIYHSTDLVNWRLIGHALNRSSQLNMRAVPCSGGVWAPTLRYHAGRFYLTTGVMHGRGVSDYSPRPFFVHTDNIFDDAAWSEPIWMDLHGIDSDLFFDDDGKVYLSVGQKYRPHLEPELLEIAGGTQAPHIVTMSCEIDIDTGRSLGAPVILRVSDVGRGIAEGPHIYKKNGWYYLLTAEGGTESLHRAIITRSRSPLGPYDLPPDGNGINPLVFNGDHPEVRNTGHADMVQGPDGSWWAVLLGVRPQSNGAAPLGRETFLVPVQWPDGEWPVFNKGQPVSLRVNHDLPSTPAPAEWRDDFDTDKLQLGWYHVRTPLKREFSLVERPGHLTLYGNGYTINSTESPSMVLRKQTALIGVWSTAIDFSPQAPYEEAGTAVFLSAYSYASLFIRLSGTGKREVVARWLHEETDALTEVTKDLDDGTVLLSIRATPTSYTLAFKQRLDEAQDLATISTSVLNKNRPGILEFTGPHFALFSQSINQPSRSPAHFDFASFRPDVCDAGSSQTGSRSRGSDAA